MPVRHTFCVVSRVSDILLESNSLNNYAISTDELARGLQKSGSTLSLLGNTIDQSAALITAGNTTLQDVDTVAAGIRTVALRIMGKILPKHVVIHGCVFYTLASSYIG